MGAMAGTVVMVMRGATGARKVCGLRAHPYRSRSAENQDKTVKAVSEASAPPVRRSRDESGIICRLLMGAMAAMGAPAGPVVRAAISPSITLT